jgi:hypothetical protein
VHELREEDFTIVGTVRAARGSRCANCRLRIRSNKASGGSSESLPRGRQLRYDLHVAEWLHERRADLVTDDQIARWQRVVDRLVVAAHSRVADLGD